MSKVFLLRMIALAAFLVLAPPAQATLLVPGAGPTPLAPGTPSLPPGSIVSNGGVVSIDTFTATDAQGRVHFTGSLHFAVYKESATGFLDFEIDSIRGE